MKRPIIIILMAFGWLAQAAAESLPLASLRLPPGFGIELFARVSNARQMALGKHTLFVSAACAPARCMQFRCRASASRWWSLTD